jgi:hypothetical protein
MQEFIKMRVPKEKWDKWYVALKKVIHVDIYGWDKCIIVAASGGLPDMSEFETKVQGPEDLVMILSLNYIEL